jgi:antitoxin ParD1/3/4
LPQQGGQFCITANIFLIGAESAITGSPDAGCRPQAILLSENGIICQESKVPVCIELELVMATRNVVLTPHQDQVIHDLVQSGRYQNASEVMREGLRLLEQRVAEDAAKIEALRQATSLGIMDLEHGRFTQVNEGDLEQ